MRLKWYNVSMSCGKATRREWQMNQTNYARWVELQQTELRGRKTPYKNRIKNTMENVTEKGNANERERERERGNEREKQKQKEPLSKCFRAVWQHLFYSSNFSNARIWWSLEWLSVFLCPFSPLFFLPASWASGCVCKEMHLNASCPVQLTKREGNKVCVSGLTS